MEKELMKLAEAVEKKKIKIQDGFLIREII